MPTQSQIEANRLNSQHSTGPRTPEGKAASSQNAFKSGLDAESQFVYGEDRADFAILRDEYFTRFQPHTPEERFHVDSLIRNEWTLRRLFRAEAHLWEYHVTHASRSDGVPLGEGFNKASSVFMRLQRRLTLTERSYKEAFAELSSLQAARPAAPAATPAEPQPDPPRPQPAPQSQQTNSPTPELGSFLSSPPATGPDPASVPPGLVAYWTREFRPYLRGAAGQFATGHESATGPWLSRRD
jgi:hypothetical protein